MTTQWAATFTGRQLGAIGVFHRISDTAKGDTKEEARLFLYKKWDHITELQLEPFRSTLDLPTVRREVESLARAHPSNEDDAKVDCFYEHDAWWVKFWNLADDDCDEVTYKVVDTNRGLELAQL